MLMGKCCMRLGIRGRRGRQCAFKDASPAAPGRSRSAALRRAGQRDTKASKGLAGELVAGLLSAITNCITEDTAGSKVPFSNTTQRFFQHNKLDG